MRHNGGKHDDATRRPDDILAEIEHTRHEMDSTLSAIEQRLTPGQLMDQGLDYLKNSGANEFVHNLGGQVKSNPMPIALVGIGLAWLMAAGKQQPSTSGFVDAGSSPSLGDRAAGLKNQVSESAAGLKNQVSNSAAGFKDKLSQAGETVSGFGQSARQRVSDLGNQARNQIDRTKGGIDYMMREQPLALGAIGLAIGACMAAMAPRTRQEDELMGEARDRLVDRAKEVGQEKLEDAKQVANAAMGTATKEAEKRGMTPASSGTTPSSSGSQGDSRARSFDGSGTQAKPPQPQTFAPPAAAGTPSIKPKVPSPTDTGTGTGKTGGTRNVP